MIECISSLAEDQNPYKNYGFEPGTTIPDLTLVAAFHIHLATSRPVENEFVRLREFQLEDLLKEFPPSKNIFSPEELRVLVQAGQLELIMAHCIAEAYHRIRKSPRLSKGSRVYKKYGKYPEISIVEVLRNVDPKKSPKQLSRLHRDVISSLDSELAFMCEANVPVRLIHLLFSILEAEVSTYLNQTHHANKFFEKVHNLLNKT